MSNRSAAPGVRVNGRSHSETIVSIVRPPWSRWARQSICRQSTIRYVIVLCFHMQSSPFTTPSLIVFVFTFTTTHLIVETHRWSRRWPFKLGFSNHTQYGKRKNNEFKSWKSHGLQQRSIQEAIYVLWIMKENVKVGKRESHAIANGIPGIRITTTLAGLPALVNATSKARCLFFIFYWFRIYFFLLKTNPITLSVIQRSLRITCQHLWPLTISSKYMGSWSLCSEREGILPFFLFFFFFFWLVTHI